MKRLFVAGGKYADIPTIISVKKMGYYVITSGNNPNDLGHKYADNVALEDYSDKKAMLRVIENSKVDILIPACDDYSILTCCYVNEKLKMWNFDDYETSKIIHHKNLWREFCCRHNIDSPRALYFKDINNAIKESKNFFQGKIIIKPIDNAAGKGVSVVEIEKDNLESALKIAFDASRDKTIVIEEFIEGSRHGFSTILINKKVVFYFYDNEQYDYNPFAVSGTTTSHSISDNMIKDLIVEIEKIANILQLKDGIFHTQTIAKDMPNGSKKLVIIEACRRAGGDLYPQFVSMAYGVDYPKMIIETIAGLTFCKQKIFKREFFARQCVMSKHIGTYKNIEFDTSIRDNVVDSLVFATKGEVIKDPKRYKAGIVFLNFESQKEMESKIRNLGKLIRINFAT